MEYSAQSAVCQVNTKAAAFETQNGESILTYYNPNCQGEMNETGMYYTQSKMCANFVYDLNGNKGPNTVGQRHWLYFCFVSDRFSCSCAYADNTRF